MPDPVADDKEKKEEKSEVSRRTEGGKDIADRLIHRYGSEKEAIRVLSEENYEYRERHRMDQEQIKKTERYVPKEGEVLLNKDQAVEWQAFSALKVPAAKVKETLDNHAKLAAEVETNNRKKQHVSVAKLMGWNDEVLTRLLTAENLHVEIREIEVDDPDKKGETVTRKVPHVRPANDEKAELKPLDKYIQKNLAPFLPALQAKEEKKESSKNSDDKGTGVVFPSQTSGKSKTPATSGDVMSSYVGSQEYATPWSEKKPLPQE